jgi:dihydrofolate reductase
MKVILTMAVSANGIIADPQGEEDFLSHQNWKRFVKLANEVGNFIWGRKTYQEVISWGGTYLDDLKKVEKIILSKSQPTLRPGFKLAHSPEQALKKLEDNGFKQAIVTGGAIINSAFAEKQLINEVRLDINPVVVGSGIPLFSPEQFRMNLKLIKMEKINGDIIEVTYQVTD